MSAMRVARAMAAVLALVVALPPARGQAASGGAPLRVGVVTVKAIPAGDGVQPGVGPGLEDIAAKLKRLPFARYELVGTTTETVAPGKPLTVPFAGTGRLVVSAAPHEASFQLSIAEHAPGVAAPCLSSQSRVDAGQAQISFCDGVPDGAATFVFITTVRSGN